MASSELSFERPSSTIRSMTKGSHARVTAVRRRGKFRSTGAKNDVLDVTPLQRESAAV